MDCYFLNLWVNCTRTGQERKQTGVQCLFPFLCHPRVVHPQVNMHQQAQQKTLHVTSLFTRSCHQAPGEGSGTSCTNSYTIWNGSDIINFTATSGEGRCRLFSKVQVGISSGVLRAFQESLNLCLYAAWKAFYRSNRLHLYLRYQCCCTL